MNREFGQALKKSFQFHRISNQLVEISSVAEALIKFDFSQISMTIPPILFWGHKMA